MCLYVVDLKNGWMKVVTESLPNSDFRSAPDLMTYFIEKSLTLGKLLKLCIESRGGEVVKEDAEGVEHIGLDNLQEWTNILLS